MVDHGRAGSYWQAYGLGKRVDSGAEGEQCKLKGAESEIRLDGRITHWLIISPVSVFGFWVNTMRGCGLGVVFRQLLV